MAAYEERYEGNGDYGVSGGGASPPQHRSSGFDDTVDSRSQHDSHDYERRSSKSRDRERERDRDRDHERDRDREKDRSRDRERDRDRHPRDHRDRERSDRRERHRSRDDDHERHRSRDHDRHRDYYRDRESRHRHRSRSKGRSTLRSRSRSRSRSKSKRISGFDMAPPASALMPGVTIPGQVTGAIGATPPVHGMFQNMLNPLTTGQFPAISLMPMQAMTQQATRHARRVYVGGLSPNANEQFSVLAEILTVWHVK